MLECLFPSVIMFSDAKVNEKIKFHSCSFAQLVFRISEIKAKACGVMKSSSHVN